MITKKQFFILILISSVDRSNCLNNVTKHKLSEYEERIKNNYLIINTTLNNNYNEVKEKPNTWDCIKEESEKEQSLVTTNGMIKKGEKEINKQTSKINDTILVIGDAGSGKTTFVQFMAGDNSKLISKEVGTESNFYLIEDGLKIGSSVSESFTLYPEEVKTDLNNLSFTDTPGFSDTRSVKHELVTTHVMKKYLKNIKKVKIVLLVTYYSLQQGIYKHDFVDLLRNCNAFIRNIEKYKNSIVLIATKVPNIYNNHNNITLISDKKVIQGISDYLSKLKTSFKEKLLIIDDDKEKIFLENSIKIVDYFQETDETGNFKKINIFRQPSETGIVSEMPLLQQGKESLKQTVYNNIKYTELLDNDIGYVLSDRAKNYLSCLIWYINDKVTNISSYLLSLLKSHYELQISNYTDIYKVYSDQVNIIKRLQILKSDLKLSNNYKNYSVILKNFILKENIQSDIMENSTYFEAEEYLNNLQQYGDTGPILSTVLWAEQINNILNFLQENLSWDKFLINVFERFSTYKVQKSKSNLYNLASVYENSTNPVKDLFSNFDNLVHENIDTYLNVTSLKEDRKNELNNIMLFTVHSKTNISCDNNGKLTITGYYIIFSLLNSSEQFKICNNKPIKKIIIYGFHTVFIDTDLKNFKGIDLIIAAPKWEIIGKREINIDGVPGKIHNSSRAEDGKFRGEDGKDGLPGLPGGNGGNFLGIGLYFINEDDLVISVQGGKGGPGQNGGHGQIGVNGINGLQKFNHTPSSDEFYEQWQKGQCIFPSDYISETSSSYLTNIGHGDCVGKISLYNQVGDCGSDGGHGGIGGTGGIGGNPGSVLILSKNYLSKFSIHNSHGESGEIGKAGAEGQKGEDGKPVTCFLNHIQDRSLLLYQHLWICSPMITYNKKCFRNMNSAVVANSNKYETNNLIQPTLSSVNDFSVEVYDYTILLKDITKNKFTTNTVVNFLDEIYEELFVMNDQFKKLVFLNDTNNSLFIIT